MSSVTRKIASRTRQTSIEHDVPGQPRFIIVEPGWLRIVPRVDRLISMAIQLAGLSHPDAVNVVLTNDRQVRIFNARYRGRNRPTNVLTFEHPAAEVVLALGTIKREAVAAGRPFAHHLLHLVLHGALHLRGFDHDHPGDARRMEMLEARLLHRIRVPNPWKFGAGAGT